MFRWLLERPTTLFGFTSGIFISVSANALSSFALAETLPNNVGKLAVSAFVSLAAAACWFVLGELIAGLRRRVGDNQEGITGTKEQAYAKALAVVAKTESWKVWLLLLLACACSVMWVLSGLVIEVAVAIWRYVTSMF